MDGSWLVLDHIHLHLILTCISGVHIDVSSSLHAFQIKKNKKNSNWVCRELHGHCYDLIITLVLWPFPWWACSSWEAERTHHNSCEVKLLNSFLPSFQSRGRSRKLVTAEERVVLHCLLSRYATRTGDVFAFTLLFNVVSSVQTTSRRGKP